ncbi:MAG TPA: P1 family peptidase [Geminicoccus sp.]|jgi:D-aminopeptidase|uniref:DmpA family aminopeptidase n=1 Tax=Geminicoccus sp. TaxID=2024832 RepID=UPI002E34386E|nr:P1 family peptidase [Geminicoccus sp.]HEX2528435.1 P1 family peptidase [Geminicoccus sp.]
MKRAREWGLPLQGEPGPLNLITDVPGIAVGLSTLVDPARGLRTGVTAILPRPTADLLTPWWAGISSLNGNGEMTGSHWIQDAGWGQGPILLTNTASVGIAHHTVVGWLVERFRTEVAEEHLWLLPVVAETYDGVLNDIMGQHVREEHVRGALDGAVAGAFPLGSVGGGTGMIAYECKGGTGSASRVLDLVGGPYTLGTLVQANHGRLDQFQVAGVPVGRMLGGKGVWSGREAGSIIVVIATDAPLLPHQLQRVARRAGLGVGRLGAIGGNSSGDIFLALSTATPAPMAPPQPLAVQPLRCLTDPLLDPIYQAVIDTTEEAVLDAMLMSEAAPSFRPKGRIVPALDGEELVGMLRTQERAGPAGPAS